MQPVADLQVLHVAQIGVEPGERVVLRCVAADAAFGEQAGRVHSDRRRYRERRNRKYDDQRQCQHDEEGDRIEHAENERLTRVQARPAR